MASQNVKRRKSMAQINVVPYIDVMLVLLVIFMVTAPLLQTGVEVELPEVSAKPLDENDTQEEPVVVTVKKNGEFYLGSDRALSSDVLITRVQALLKTRRDSQAYVRGDRNVAYGRVMEAMVILQKAGVAKIGLITDPPEDKTARR